ncbi:hypothetical protein C8A00DRAFT_30849 [Chaetomidium leptoderma]|uniref:Uncharacterized protein n=1 Tax=Chaetomidium leptoderma TaxID=669021 RepID=A0AAN6VRH8_9PEZI|nr:hypothetical protein C8A00DRAFT_30849 [Chaetomidium leptoderma]
MCDYDEFLFTCGHSAIRFKCYCHSARNHPTHACRRVKKLRDCWLQGRKCDACTAAQAYYNSQGQGQGGGNGS